MRRFAIALACAVAIAVVPKPVRAHAHPVSPHGENRVCIVYEDDSFICGRALPAPGPSWGVDRTFPWIEGCIPGGLCDTPYTDDCPPPLEDVECWIAVHGR